MQEPHPIPGLRLARAKGIACAASLALLLPAMARANGGSGGWTEETEGALAPAEAGPLGKRTLVKERDVECVSEDLAITLGKDQVSVTVDYVFQNRGKTKQLDYAFPFAIGQQQVTADATKERRRELEGLAVLGEPKGYAIQVDGQPAKAVEQQGRALDDGIPVPEIRRGSEVPSEPSDDGSPASQGETVGGETSYRWTYFVTPISFPAGKPVSVQVKYTTPYLVYSRHTELGDAHSPGSFSYLLSTGGGWRGGTIGKLRVSVRTDGVPLSQVELSGLPFVANGTGASFEASGFRPTRARDIFVKLSEFQRVPFKLACCTEHGLKNPVELEKGRNPLPWLSPPVQPRTPVTIQLLPTDEGAIRREYGGGNETPKRFRIGFSFDPQGKRFARPKKIQVAIEFQSEEAQDFSASFQDVPDEQVRANAGARYLFFDAASIPAKVELALLDVFPGEKGERRVQLTGITLERDVSNYQGFIPAAR